MQNQQGIVCNGDPVRIFREIGASGEIVQTDIVEIRQQDGTGKGKFSFSLFIFAIYWAVVPRYAAISVCVLSASSRKSRIR